jgi:hypothetical protein
MAPMDTTDYHANPLIRLLVWLVLGLIGGTVHTCENSNHYTLRRNLTSLLTSGFAGMIGGMLFHNIFEDPMILGGACAMMGYTGQLALVLIQKWVQNKVD